MNSPVNILIDSFQVPSLVFGPEFNDIITNYLIKLHLEKQSHICQYKLLR